MSARVAETAGRGQDVDQVDSRPLARDEQLDDVVEQARDAADQHQPPRAALNHEERNDCDDAGQDLPVTRRHVDQLHRVHDRTPVEALDEGRDPDVDGQPKAIQDEDGVDAEQHEHRQRGPAQPAPGGFLRLAGKNLLRGFLRLRAHRGRMTLSALSSAEIDAGVRPTRMLSA